MNDLVEYGRHAQQSRAVSRRESINETAQPLDTIGMAPGHDRLTIRSNFATADVSAGCLICSVASRSLSRHGPTLDRVCSTDSAEKFNRSEAGSRMNTELKSSMETVSCSTA
jgi:hypothetical protein